MSDPADPEPQDGPRRTSSTGVPAEGAVVQDRFSSDEIFQRIIAAADEEITAGRRELFFAGVAGGLSITITVLVYASLWATTGPSVEETNRVVASLLYPIGFIYIILGGYQLYTENTLPPVALTLERLASVPALLRNWTVVLAGNFLGGAIGALVLAHGGVLTGGADQAAMVISQKGVEEGVFSLFTKGALAGLIVAGVVWVEYAARDTISRLVVIYLAFLCIPLGNLFHVVVSFTEMTYLLALGEVGAVVGMTEFVVPVLLGNTVGGVVLVTVVNYYQTSEHRLGQMGDSADGGISRLRRDEWLFGRLAGRSYVPVIEHHEPAVSASEGGFRIFVPVSNPRTERNLLTLACTLAEHRPGASVHIAHMVQVPDEMHLQHSARQRARIRDESASHLSDLVRYLDDYDVPVRTSTVVSHNAFEEIFNQAGQDDADLVVMGWDDDRHWDTLRVGRPINELTRGLPCDFVVLDDRNLDISRVLVPTADGPDSALSAEVALALRDAAGANVTLLHVVDSSDERAEGQAFLEKWARAHELSDATMVVDDTGDIEEAIEREAQDHSLLLLGATERGILSRLASSSLHFEVVNEVDCSVVLTERPHERTVLHRLLG